MVGKGGSGQGVRAFARKEARMEERRARRGRLGCWSVAVVTGLAALFPTFHARIHPAARSAPPAAPRQPAVCLEAWVRLRSYRGCPVLAAAAGYRLGIYCSPAGWSNGALVFAGPFAGRAYLSEEPVPLGHWVHLAALRGGAAVPEDGGAVPGGGPALPGGPAAPGGGPAVPGVRVLLAIDGSDVTAGRLFAQGDPLPLGYDPWRDLSAAAAAGAEKDRRRRGLRAGHGLPGPADGEIGAWRLSRGWRPLAEVAAGRGTPLWLAALPPPQQRRPAAQLRSTGGITGRGWRIVGGGLLVAAAMVGAGVALRRRGAGAESGERRLERIVP
jgi:hypothetical protein